MTVPELRTARLQLRPLRPADADGLHDALGHREVTRYLSDVSPTRERTRAIVGNLCAATYPTGMGHWVWQDRASGALVGRGYLVPSPVDPHGRPEVGWFLGRLWWGTGLAGEAGQAILRYAFVALALPAVTARVHPDNEASLRLATRLGFTGRETFGDDANPRLLMVAPRRRDPGRGYPVGRPG
jgi:RimJ/RimL family protein N-acetyltransferase